MIDYFEVFGLPRRLGIDGEALQRRFYDLSRRHHPDFHQRAGGAAQAEALATSAAVNAAYRTLRDPIARLEYLLRLEDGDAPPAPGDEPKAPPELLAELFEIQESLDEAKAGGLDDPTRARLRVERDRLRDRHAAEERRLSGPLSRAWDEVSPAERPRIQAAARRTLATRAYLRTVIDDLSVALGEGEEPGGSNRRH